MEGRFEADSLSLFSVMDCKTNRPVWHCRKGIEETFKFYLRLLLPRGLGNLSRSPGKRNSVAPRKDRDLTSVFLSQSNMVGTSVCCAGVTTSEVCQQEYAPVVPKRNIS